MIGQSKISLVTLSEDYIKEVENLLEKVVSGGGEREFLQFSLKEGRFPLLHGDEKSIEEVLQERLAFLKSIYSDFKDFQVEKLKIPEEVSFLFELWQMWIPLAEVYIRGWQVKQETADEKETPYFVMLSGAQGSGKTVTTNVLQWLIPKLWDFKATTGKCSVKVLSIDSLYKTNRERIQLRNRLRLDMGLCAVEKIGLGSKKKQECESQLRDAIRFIEEIELILGTPKIHSPQEGEFVERTIEEKNREVKGRLLPFPKDLQVLLLASIEKNPFSLSPDVRRKILLYFLKRCSLDEKQLDTIIDEAVKGNPFYEVARGLPNTHYVDKFLDIYKGFCERLDVIELPHFEKLFHGGIGDIKTIDRILRGDYPEIFILEGWFVGVPTDLSMEEVERIIRSNNYVFKIMDELDPERRHTEVMLKRLKPYKKIWDIFDIRTFLLIDDIRNVERSRARQEETNRKHRVAELKSEGLSDEEIGQMKLGMTPEEIADFVKPYILLTYIILSIDLFKYNADIIFQIHSSDYKPRVISVRGKD